MNILIAFKSRNSVIAFSRILRQYNIPNTIVNTPKSISISCSQSVETSFKYFNIVKSLIQQSNIPGFIGVFLAGEKTTRLM